jgi:hypothetical protein
MAQVVNGRLPPPRSGFCPRPVRVSFVVDRVALEKFFSPSTSVFPSHHVSNNSPSYNPFIYHRFCVIWQLSGSLNKTPLARV